MSGAIITSLQKLNSAVQNLENAVQGKASEIRDVRKSAAAAKKTAQDDLFSVMAKNTAQPSNANALNVKMLATRLDNAINQVEMILKEGRG